MFKEKSLVYRIAQTDLYISIAEPFLRIIRQCVVEHQSLADVPAGKSIKGILFQELDQHHYALRKNGQEQEIPINLLQFETGNFHICESFCL
jgi:hypothetical protein